VPSQPTTVPGPRGHWLWGTLPEFRRDRLGFLLSTARTYGGVAQLGRRRPAVFLISEPAAVKHVLQDNAENYGRNTRGVAALRETLGDGLLTTSGAPWRRNRRLAQPAFHRQRLAGFATVMADAAAGLVARLRSAGAGGASFDVVPEFSRVALQIVGRCLFQRDLSDEADQVGRALRVALHHTMDKAQALFPLPSVLPTPANLRFHAALRTLDRLVLSLIDQRRREGGDRGDLLSMLLLARDEDGGEGLSNAQLRDELITLLLAGHETTAMAMSWTMYLLARHRGVQRELHREAGQVVDGAAPSLDQLPRLHLTRAVLEESMRLYPPAWVVTRSANAADQVGGHAIPPGAIVLVSPYVTHRDPLWWPDPERFDPSRFASAAHDGPAAKGAPERPRYAYYPFGGGPHLCIGAGFAMMEATILLGALARALTVDLDESHPVAVEALVTLRPRHGLWLRATPT
jgi:cytochrome P450